MALEKFPPNLTVAPLNWVKTAAVALVVSASPAPKSIVPVPVIVIVPEDKVWAVVIVIRPAPTVTTLAAGVVTAAKVILALVVSVPVVTTMVDPQVAVEVVPARSITPLALAVPALTLKALVYAAPGWFIATVFSVAVTVPAFNVRDWAAAVVEVNVKALVTVKLVLAVMTAEAAIVN